MGDETKISFPDGGMVASGMSTHPCTKIDYHYLYKENKDLRARNAELEQCKEECTQRVIQQAKKMRALEAEVKKEVASRIYAEKLLVNEPCTVESHKALEAEVARLRKENEALVKAVHAACSMLEK